MPPKAQSVKVFSYKNHKATTIGSHVMAIPGSRVTSAAPRKAPTKALPIPATKLPTASKLPAQEDKSPQELPVLKVEPTVPEETKGESIKYNYDKNSKTWRPLSKLEIYQFLTGKVQGLGIIKLDLSAIGAEVNNDLLINLSSRLVNLESLEICGTYKIHEPSGTPYSNEVRDGLISFAENCKKLKSLEIVDCAGLTNEVAAELIKKCPNLSSINFARCSITDRFIDIFSKEHPFVRNQQIKFANFSNTGVTPEGAQRFHGQFPKSTVIFGNGCVLKPETSHVNKLQHNTVAVARTI